jgi:hypothetical protein
MTSWMRSGRRKPDDATNSHCNDSRLMDALHSLVVL